MHKQTVSLPPKTLIPSYQHCEKCSQLLSQSHWAFGNKWFYCTSCEVYTRWDKGTKLEKSKISGINIEMLLKMFLANKTPKDASDVLGFDFVDQNLNLNTIRRHFTIFCTVVLDYYQKQMSYILLENEVEIDETHLFKEKNSSAPHRSYKLSSIWIFGAKQRNSSKFILFPMKTRKEEDIVPLLRKHIKIGSKIYSDSFSVYVNNKRKESKLQRYLFAKFIKLIGLVLYISLLITSWSLYLKFRKKFIQIR